jgi:putative membrane protein
MGCAMAGMGAWSIVGSVIWLVVLALIVAAGVWLARRLFTTTSATSPHPADADSAREVLRRRYAAGEIDDEEFERRLAGLNFH